MTYGEIIRRGREARRMTQEQLAEALEVSRQAVSKWEMDLSRPARGKLERLSAVLEIPAETWAEIDAEQVRAETPADTSRPWKLAAAVLGALCLALAVILAVVLWRQAHPSTLVPSEEAPAGGQETALIPETLALESRHDFEFGDIPLGGEYGPELVPYLDDPDQVLEHALWEDAFPDGTRIALAETSADWDTFRALYHLYILYDLPGDEAGWKILYRIAEDLPDPQQAQPEAKWFADVLERNGFKLTLYNPAWNGWDSTYLSQREDGVPCMVTSTWNMGQEADLDEDGQMEIIYLDDAAWAWEIVDTVEGEEGAFVYTLPAAWDIEGTGTTLDFDPAKGGFVVTDGGGVTQYRYLLREGCLVRVPLADFGPEHWPDVAGTRLTFVAEGDLSDGTDPDALLPGASCRISHRQQAYLALQELYNLTGLKIEECYCCASEYGVYFSLRQDGFGQRSFYAAHFDERRGGAGIPSIYITWKEFPNGSWSPLSAADALHPEPGTEPIAWYYDRMAVFWTGEMDRGFGEDLYLKNGDRFQGTFLDTEWGSVLVSLYGPYPDGIVNH